MNVEYFKLGIGRILMVSNGFDERAEQLGAHYDDDHIDELLRGAQG